MATPAPHRNQPTAPPAYRPQALPKVLQTKKAVSPHTAQGLASTKPVAPPVYRPQTAPKVLQTKKAAVEGQARPGPVAPTAYRPQAVPRVLQTKKAAVQHPRAGESCPATVIAPPVNRQPQKMVQPKPARPAPPVKASPTPPPHGNLGASQMTASAAHTYRSAALQPKMAPGAGKHRGKVVQMAGTKPRSFSTNGKYLVKLTSAREEFIYQQRGALGLDNVMAGYYPEVVANRVVVNNEVTRVTLDKNGQHKQITLKDPISVPTNAQRIIIIDTLGYEKPQQNQVQPQVDKFVMDIKIGTYTKSTEQFEAEGAGGAWRLFKKLEHNWKDLTHGSRSQGFDICDGSGEFDAAVRRIRGGQGGQQAKTDFKTALDQILVDLGNVRNAVQHSTVTFVGSSVFCIFNLTNPQSSLAKLIDPDHPIMLNDLLPNKPADVMSPNTMDAQNQTSWIERDWNEYQQKWTQSFNTGIANLIMHFQTQKALLDVALPKSIPRFNPMLGPI
jgi:hypothetical protein